MEMSILNIYQVQQNHKKHYYYRVVLHKYNIHR